MSLSWPKNRTRTRIIHILPWRPVQREFADTRRERRGRVVALHKLKFELTNFGVAVGLRGHAVPALEGVMEGGGVGKAQRVGGLRGCGVRAEQEAAREVAASLFDQEPVRGRFLAQFSLQGAAAEAEVAGSFAQTEIAAAQALADEAEDALREIGIARIHR